VLHLTPDYQSEIESTITRNNGHVQSLIHRQAHTHTGREIVA
jgi:hypothetical protein